MKTKVLQSKVTQSFPFLYMTDDKENLEVKLFDLKSSFEEPRIMYKKVALDEHFEVLWCLFYISGEEPSVQEIRQMLIEKYLYNCTPFIAGLTN